MTKEKIEAVKTEMQRVAARINELQKSRSSEDAKKYNWLMPKQTGALRRASMDLTRSLADLRRR